MSENINPLDMADFIDMLNNHDLESPLKVKVNNEEAVYVNDTTVHAYGGDYHEMAFDFTTGAKHGQVAVVRELAEQLEDYVDSTMDDYGGSYWHDGDCTLHYASYGDGSNLQPIAIEKDQHGVVTVVIASC